MDRRQVPELIRSCEPLLFACLTCRLLVDGYERDIPLYVDVSSNGEALSVNLFEPLPCPPDAVVGLLNGFNNRADHFKYRVDQVGERPYFFTTAIDWKGTLPLETFDRWLDALIDAHCSAVRTLRQHGAG